MYTSQDTPSDDVTDFHETLILYVICRANAEFQLIFALAFAVLEIGQNTMQHWFRLIWTVKDYKLNWGKFQPVSKMGRTRVQM